MKTKKSYDEQISHAVSLIVKCTELSSRKSGEKPVLKGSQFTITKILNELSDGKSSLSTIAEDYHLDLNMMKEVLRAIAVAWDISLPKPEKTRQKTPSL